MYEKNIQGFTDQAREHLSLHTWPGNIRELQNVTERAVILNEGHNWIDVSDLLLPSIRDNNSQSEQKLKISATSGSLKLINEKIVNGALENLFYEGFDLEHFNDQIIQVALNKCDGNVSKAARLLNISRAKLDYRLGKFSQSNT